MFISFLQSCFSMIILTHCNAGGLAYGSQCNIWIYKNSTGLYYGQTRLPCNMATSTAISTNSILQLESGDYFEIITLFSVNTTIGGNATSNASIIQIKELP